MYTEKGNVVTSTDQGIKERDLCSCKGLECTVKGHVVFVVLIRESKRLVLLSQEPKVVMSLSLYRERGCCVSSIDQRIKE